MRTYVAEVTSPVFCAFRTDPELNLDLKVFLTNDLGGTGFVYLLRFAID